MKKIIAIPYKTFKERMRLTNEFITKGYHVEFYDDVIICIKTMREDYERGTITSGNQRRD